MDFLLFPWPTSFLLHGLEFPPHNNSSNNLIPRAMNSLVGNQRDHHNPKPVRQAQGVANWNGLMESSIPVGKGHDGELSQAQCPLPKILQLALVKPISLVLPVCQVGSVLML